MPSIVYASGMIWRRFDLCCG